jgi:hypothetical protein
MRATADHDDIRRPDRSAGEPMGAGTRPDGHWRRPGVVALLWFGVLAAPLAFLLDLAANFALVERVCAMGGDGLLWGTTAAAALLAAAGGAQAWRSFRAIGEDPAPRGEGVEHSDPQSTGHTLASELRTDAPGPVGRSRFMALAGIAVSAYFLVIVLASLIPAFVLSPCD